MSASDKKAPTPSPAVTVPADQYGQFLAFLAQQQAQTQQALQDALARDKRSPDRIFDLRVGQIENLLYRDALLEGPFHLVCIWKPPVAPVFQYKNFRIGGSGSANEAARTLGDSDYPETPAEGYAVALEIQAFRPKGAETFKWFVRSYDAMREVEAFRKEQRARLAVTRIAPGLTSTVDIEAAHNAVDKILMWETAAYNYGLVRQLNLGDSRRRTLLSEVAPKIIPIAKVASLTESNALLGFDTNGVRVLGEAPVFGMSRNKTLADFDLARDLEVPEVAASRQKLAREAASDLENEQKEIR